MIVMKTATFRMMLGGEYYLEVKGADGHRIDYTQHPRGQNSLQAAVHYSKWLEAHHQVPQDVTLAEHKRFIAEMRAVSQAMRPHQEHA